MLKRGFLEPIPEKYRPASHKIVVKHVGTIQPVSLEVRATIIGRMQPDMVEGRDDELVTRLQYPYLRPELPHYVQRRSGNPEGRRNEKHEALLWISKN